MFSPVKYWKAHHLINKKILEGYAFNRRHFHTQIDACIMCALWSNEPSDITEFNIRGNDINSKTNELLDEVILPVKRCYSLYSEKFYDKREYADTTDGVLLDFDGTEISKDRSSVRQTPFYNDNIIGYLAVKGANFDNPDASVHLLRTAEYDGNGFYVRTTNFLQSMPMFAASRYITYNREWTERSRVMKSADKAERFLADVQNGRLDGFLLKCLLFTCIEMQNHCRSFTGSDGRYYRNELCLDTTHGETIASAELKRLIPNETETKIFKLYTSLMEHVKETKEYDDNFTYGIYQITEEIDTSYTDTSSKKKKTIYNNIQVHSDLRAMKELCKEYYNREIVPTLFEYELLK